jgi:hypothetical protein
MTIRILYTTKKIIISCDTDIERDTIIDIFYKKKIVELKDIKTFVE